MDYRGVTIDASIYLLRNWCFRVYSVVEISNSRFGKMELIDNRYKVIRQIGKGAFGSVFQVYDSRDESVVCLKILDSVFSGKETDIAREFALLTRLSHPHLLKVFDFGIDSERGPYFTMEYAERGDIGQSNSLPPNEFVAFFNSICSALDYIHRNNIFHGDLKPRNILIDKDGNFRLGDFGLAGSVFQSRDNRAFGNAAYIAPEALRNQGIGPASDIYSFGLLCYELITNHRLFGEKVDDILTRKLSETPPLEPIPEEYGGTEFTTILQKMIAGDPDRRYRSFRQVISDYDAISCDAGSLGDDIIQSAGFVGRAAELEWLNNKISLWSEGRNTALLIAGDSGIGKSALLEEFRTRSQLSGFKFYRAYCRENDLRPFSPILKILDHLLSELDPQSRKFDTLGPDLKRLYPARFPEISAEQLTETEIKSSRRRLFDNLIRYFGDLCVQNRVIIALEDIQWADSDTLEFLEAAFTNETQSKENASFVICTAQVESDNPAARLISAFPTKIYNLGPFDISTWSIFLNTILGERNGLDEFAEELYRESGGNFLFAFEILRELAVTKLLVRGRMGWQIADDWREKLKVPQGLLPILMRRLDRLPSEPRSIAEIGAAIGASFLPGDIAAIGGSSLAQDKNFNELLDFGILRWVSFGNERRLDFAHGQFRRAAYKSVSKENRRRYHGRIAEHLEAIRAGSEILGHHYLMAANFSRAFGYLLESASNAETIFAYRNAAQFYKLALTCLDELPPSHEITSERYKAFLGLGRSLDFISPTEATEPFQNAYDIASLKDGAKFDLAEAALALGNNFVHIGENEKALDYLLKAVEIANALGEKRLGGESCIGLGFAYDRMGRFGDSERSYMQALDLFSNIDHAEGSCRALNYLGISRKKQGDFNGALDFYRRALDISLERKFLWLSMNLYGNLGNLHLARSEFDKGLEYYTRSLELSREISDRRIESINLLNIGHVNNESGHIAEAERFFSEAIAKFEEIGDRGSEAVALNNLGLLYFRTGEIKKSLDTYGRGLDLSAAIGQPRPELANHIGLAEVLFAIADYDNALEETRKSIEIARKMNDMEQLTAILALDCELLFELGRLDDAESVVREYLALPENAGDPIWRRRTLLIGKALRMSQISNEIDITPPGDKWEPLRVRLEAAAMLNNGKSPEIWLARIDDAIRKAGGFYQHADVWRLRALKIAYLEICGEKFEKAREEEKLRAEISSAMTGLDRQLENKLFLTLKIESPGEKGNELMIQVSREERLEVLIRVSRTINTIRELDPLLNKIMDSALETLGGERGFIMLFSDESDSGSRMLESKVARNLAHEDILSETTISYSSALDVARTGKPLILARTESNIEARQSVLDFRISSVLCAPLTVKGEILGIVYVDSRSGKTFTGDDLEFLTNFADLAAIAIANARMAERLSKKNIYLQKQVESIWGFGNIVGRSSAMQKVFRMAESVSGTDVTLVISGESGTGKEILARAIHFAGPRKGNNFMPVDCGALAETLLESELFGYIKGAFTGAASDREGLFEVAEGGTVFLDEVNNTSKGFQAKLLRVLQESEIRRVGDNRIRKINVRIIAATNKDLTSEVEAGNFREDLFYRLNVVTIALPALRERPEDIPLLANYFLEKICGKMKLPLKTFSQGALDLLLMFGWPGNVRQLENVCERAIIFSSGAVIDIEDLPIEIRSLKSPGIRGAVVSAAPKTKGELKAEKLRLERLFLTNLLNAAEGNVMEASRISGMDRSQIHHLMSRLGINSSDYRKGD